MKNFIRTFFLMTLVLSSCIALGVTSVHADGSLTNEINRQLEAGGARTGLNADTDIRVTVAVIIKAFLGLLGIIAVVLMLYAGFLWMTAGGNSEQVGTAKSIIINATIGLAVLLSAYAITYAVFSIILDAGYAF
jgi:hypothetical protein